MSSQFMLAELRRFTLSELHALHARLLDELGTCLPYSPESRSIERALAAVRCEITRRVLPKPRF